MGLETAATIKALVATNPTSTDPRDQGDDHLRMLKTVLKAMFPGQVTPFGAVQVIGSLTTLTLDSIYSVQVSSTSLTINLPAFASVPAGYCFFVYAKGGGVTLTPSGAETINSASTLVVGSGSWVFVLKGATAWDALLVARSGANADITGLSAIAAGTALLPSITPTGDPNTGVWFPAADTVAVSTGGVEKMRIDTSGHCYLGGSVSDYSLVTYKTASQVNGYSISGAVAGGTVILNSVGASTDISVLYSVKGNAAHTFYINNGSTKIGTIDANGIVVNTPTGGLGYGAGAGGTATQGAGSGKQTGVTLSKPTGVITMDTANLNAGARVSFLFTNTILDTNDVLLLRMQRGTGTAGGYSFSADVTNDLAYVTIQNETAGNLAEGFLLQFIVIKGATA